MPVYRIIVEQGNQLPAKEAFLNVNAFFNRFIVKLSSTYKLKHAQLNMLCCLHSIVRARGKPQAFALSTLSRNFYTPWQHKAKFIAYCHDMHEKGLVTLEYKGQIKGSKIAITHLGNSVLDEFYDEFKQCMQNFPIQG
jgi:hypothetical protein